MKKILLGGGALAIAVVLSPLFAAFEAHVVNVTAQIENALGVTTNSIDFGTVFPQEHLEKPLGISLSQSFLDEPRVDDINYFIRQKPKCGVTSDNGTVLVDPTWTGHVLPDGSVDCEQDRPANVGEPHSDDLDFYLLPSLCEYISKEGPDQNDETTLSFHRPWEIVGDVIDWNDTRGRLAKSEGDTSDEWVIDLAVPCFGDHCAQDWANFVNGVNPQAGDPNQWVQPIENEHKIFGCNLWVEVSGVSEAEEPVRPEVGALLSGYKAPTFCTTTVNDDESLQGAISNNGIGGTVCVDPSYTGNGDVAFDFISANVEGQTIAGLGVAGSAIVNKGIFIDADNVTITGLTLNAYSTIAASANAAIYIHNEVGQGSGNSLNGTVISYNTLTAPVDAKTALLGGAKAIITEIGSGSTIIANGIVVSHNMIDGWKQGIFFNTANADVHHNDFMDNDVGIANDGPESTAIHHNDFEGNVLEAVGVAQDAVAGTTNDGVLTVNFNNFTPAGLGNDVNQYGSDALPNVNAENNWWDGEAEALRTNDPAEIDTDPAEASAFPEN